MFLSSTSSASSSARSSASSSPAAQSPIYHFKILVPATAAGRIIGKGGTTIAQLQKDAGARVKMSKASEFYPGTTERICLISGPIEGILKINDFFMENFSSSSVRILVPNSTAGMIIGKGGNYIRQIKEESGAFIQISQKCPEISLPERCVTIVGDLDSIRKACAMILAKIVEDVGCTYRDIRTSSLSYSLPSPSWTPTRLVTSAPPATTLATASTAGTNNHNNILTTTARTSLHNNYYHHFLHHNHNHNINNNHHHHHQNQHHQITHNNRLTSLLAGRALHLSHLLRADN